MLHSSSCGTTVLAKGHDSFPFASNVTDYSDLPQPDHCLLGPRFRYLWSSMIITPLLTARWASIGFIRHNYDNDNDLLGLNIRSLCNHLGISRSLIFPSHRHPFAKAVYNHLSCHGSECPLTHTPLYTHACDTTVLMRTKWWLELIYWISDKQYAKLINTLKVGIRTLQDRSE